MISFRVDDMTCGHCASAITRAVKAADDVAEVRVDLARHLVHVEPAKSPAGELQAAIARAGYSPVPARLAGAGQRPVKAGGCCGCC